MSRRALIEHYQDFWLASPEFVDLQQAMEPEAAALREYQQDMMEQLVPDTATWGLKYWEQTLGIPVDEAQDISVRRSRVRARLLGAGTVTAFVIRDIAAGYVQEEVSVVERPREYRVVICFHGGLPLSFHLLDRDLSEIMPAHLAWDYLFVPAPAEHRLYTGFAVRIGRKVSVDCEIPAELDVMYLVDENGDILTDESGNRFIDTEEA